MPNYAKAYTHVLITIDLKACQICLLCRTSMRYQSYINLLSALHQTPSDGEFSIDRISFSYDDYWNWIKANHNRPNWDIYMAAMNTVHHMTTALNGNIFRVTFLFDVLFDLRLNKRLNKQPWGWWFETPSPSLRRHCDDTNLVNQWNSYHFHKPSQIQYDTSFFWANITEEK